MPFNTERFRLVGGLVLLLTFGFVAWKSGLWVYHRFVLVPAASLAVSAWFDCSAKTAARDLRVGGVVLKSAAPSTPERVRLSVEDWKTGIRQSILLDIDKTGQFVSPA